MEHHDKEYCLEVWGPFACFTQPALKVERFSYDVITPSAARAIFESIFWKPAIRWEVTRIEVINPIKKYNILRNEVGAIAGKKAEPIFIEDKRQQKNSVVLRDVRYRIHAKLVFIPLRERQDKHKPGHDMKDENPGKYQAMFERRAKSGQCFNQPYLGTREFSAFFRYVDNDIEASPIAESRDLGLMLYDMDFKGNLEKPDPMYFHAVMENGVIIVPPPGSKEILR